MEEININVTKNIEEIEINVEPNITQVIITEVNGGGGIESVSGNLVDNTDPNNPIVNGLADVIAGTNITIDKTDPANPVISAATAESQQIPLQVLEVTLSDLGVSTMAEVNPTVVQAYVSTLNTPLEVDKVFTVRVVEGEEAPLNEFVWSEGNAPTLEDFETAIGFSLINGQKVGDTITFDNTGYNIPDNAFANASNLLSVVSLAETAGDNCFNLCTSVTSFDFPNLESAGEYCFQLCESATDLTFPNLITAGIFCFDNCSLVTSFDFPNLTSVGDECFNACSAMIIFNTPYLNTIGSTTGNNFVFDAIIGNTITVTVPISNQTSNGGNLEGDLQQLDDNNTVTFIWV